MRVYEVMTKAVETVKPAVLASEARNRMRQQHIHHLVVTHGNELRGVVSERDLGGSKLPKSLGKWTVEDLMTTPVVTVTPEPAKRFNPAPETRGSGSSIAATTRFIPADNKASAQGPVLP